MVVHGERGRDAGSALARRVHYLSAAGRWQLAAGSLLQPQSNASLSDSTGSASASRSMSYLAKRAPRPMDSAGVQKLARAVVTARSS